MLCEVGAKMQPCENSYKYKMNRPFTVPCFIYDMSCNFRNCTLFNVPSKESDQPASPHSLMIVLTVHF